MSCRTCMRDLVELSEGVNTINNNIGAIRMQFNDSVASLVRCLDDDNAKLREDLSKLQTKQIVRELYEENNRQEKSTQELKGLAKTIGDFLEEQDIVPYSNNSNNNKYNNSNNNNTNTNNNNNNNNNNNSNNNNGRSREYKTVSDVKSRLHQLLDEAGKMECEIVDLSQNEIYDSSKETKNDRYDDMNKVRQENDVSRRDVNQNNENEYPTATLAADSTIDDVDDLNETHIFTSESHDVGDSRRGTIYQKIRHIRTMLTRREQEITTSQLVIDDQVCVFQETSTINF